MQLLLPDYVTQAGGTASLSVTPIGTDMMEFQLTVSGATWLGFGFSSGDIVSMSGGQQGVDTFVCSDGAIRRVWMDNYFLPEGQSFAEASCSESGGSTVMTFTRSIAAEGEQQRALTLGTAQSVIYAFGQDGQRTAQSHGGNKYGMKIDFGQMASPSTGTGGVCNDSNVNCPAWQAAGECSTNPDYMLSACQMSCGICTNPSGGNGNNFLSFADRRTVPAVSMHLIVELAAFIIAAAWS
jgi:hypothetical protein